MDAINTLVSQLSIKRQRNLEKETKIKELTARLQQECIQLDAQNDQYDTMIDTLTLSLNQTTPLVIDHTKPVECTISIEDGVDIAPDDTPKSIGVRVITKKIKQDLTQTLLETVSS